VPDLGAGHLQANLWMGWSAAGDQNAGGKASGGAASQELPTAVRGGRGRGRGGEATASLDLGP
jgi:hypothetical protein